MSLVLGGAAFLLVGMLCWRMSPQKRADRLLNKARQKVNEIEGVLANWETL
jgi:hypothetical protein